MNLTRIELGVFPSPVRQIVSPTGATFWLKDDGVISPLYGGNKVRKLEFLLAEARGKQKNHLVVHGDIESHTVKSCCVFGRQKGFNVDAVMFPHRGQSSQSPVLHELEELGVRVHVRSNMLLTLVHAQLLSWRKGAYLIPLGASTPHSTLGYVLAADELLEQIRTDILPEPHKIYLPFATGGTIAGLLVGLTRVSSQIKVVAVQTVESFIANQRNLERLVGKALEILGENRVSIGDCMKRLDRIDSRYLGKGYRDVPQSVVVSVDFAAKQNLILETAFSGKALAALLDDLQAREQSSLLFWNTHDQHH